MKAMILAAGLGTRLLPFTSHTPKPLFSISGQAILDRTIQKLQFAGADAVMVNTHHLHAKIEKFIEERNYAIPVQCTYEPEILGTGGAIKNVAGFWDNAPFWVVNSDILFDFRLQEAYQYHLQHGCDVTLVLCDDPEFNQVRVARNENIIDFGVQAHTAAKCSAVLTFTGIHILNPEVLRWIPAGQFADIIDVYRNMLDHGVILKAYVPSHGFWKDIGALKRYRDIVYEEMAARAFQAAFSCTADLLPRKTKLKGDGSDRSWYRLTHRNLSMVLADHGIYDGQAACEAASFVAIGNHLKEKNIPVPEIFLYDTFAGLVFMEDLGDRSLQALVLHEKTAENISSLYRAVIDRLIQLSQSGIKDFDPAWTLQSRTYDRTLIVEKECFYFLEAFIHRYLHMTLNTEGLEKEFSTLARETLQHAFPGLMHRDMQSRNIMFKNGQPYFIDFQGAREGPLQYDLASLLLDPYVGLDWNVRETLLAYCMARLSSGKGFDKDGFKKGYEYCSITRNLQILGAFGHLSKNKGKSYFATYIPAALSTLHRNLRTCFNEDQFPLLTEVADKAMIAMNL